MAVLVVASAIALYTSGNHDSGAISHAILGGLAVLGVIFQVLIGFTRNAISGFSEATKRSPDDHGPRWVNMTCITHSHIVD